MGKVTTIALPKEPQMWFVASDWHSYHLHMPSFEILIKHANMLPKKQRNLIINGDFIDQPYFMAKNPDFQTWVSRKDGIDNFFLPEFEREMKWGNDTLDALQGVFNHIVFVSGNHDDLRTNQFREKHCPVEYKAHFNFEDKLNLLKRGIGFVTYGDWLDIGELSITHGNYCGPMALKKHFEASGGRNVIFGHVHTAETKSFTSRGETRCAWSLPAMCDLNPHYIRNSDTCWVNGYATVFMKPNGKFNVHTHLVMDGELLLPDGTILTGTKV